MSNFNIFLQNKFILYKDTKNYKTYDLSQVFVCLINIMAIF